MQHSLFFTPKRGAAAQAAALLAASLAASLTFGARAAELGDLQVHSYLGQPLVADIELVSIAADETANLQVRLASPDVYRIANIAIQPVLQGLNVTLMRREQRQFVHITSLKPVDTSHLVLFFELTGAGRSAVRETTVLLSPDPHPPAPLPPPYIPPPVAAMPAPAPPAPVPAPAPAPVPDAALVAALARAAMPAPAFKMPATAPAADADHHAHVAAAALEHEPAAKAEKSRPKSEPHPVAAVAAAKVEDSSAYIALDKKNAALSKKLLELEGKIRQLQDQVGVKPAPSSKPAASGASASAPAEPVALKAPPRPLLHKLKPLKAVPAPKKPAETGVSPLVWLGIGTAALLLVIGIGVFLFQRRHRRKGDRSPSKFWVMLRKPFQRKKATAPSLPVVADSPLTETGHAEHE